MARKDNPLEYSPNGELCQGSGIRQLRQQRGLSLTELADLVGYSTASLSKVENNNAPASSEKLKAISGVLGVNEDELKRLPLHPRLSRQAKNEGRPTREVLAQQPFNLRKELQLLHQRLDGIEATLKELKETTPSHASQRVLKEPVPSRFVDEGPVSREAFDVNLSPLVASYLEEVLEKVGTQAELGRADLSRDQASKKLQIWDSTGSMQNKTPPPIEPEQIHGTEQVLRRAINLVRESLERPESPHEILITFLREQDGFEIRPDIEGVKGEWLEALRGAIERGIRITQLCKLQEGHSKVLTLIKDIFDLLGTPGAYDGAYEPFYFPQKYWRILPAYDLLIVPEVGALQFFGSENHIDTALFWPTGDDLKALHAEFSYLQRRCERIFTLYPARSPQFLDAVERAEQQDGDLYTVKSGLSVKFEPIELLEERVRPVIENGGPKSKQFMDLIDSRKRRRDALFEQLDKGFRVRNICPESAIRDFRINGLYSKDDWTVAFGGQEVIPRQVDNRIQAVVDLLETYPEKFELALLDEKNDQGIFATPHWKVKVGHSVFLESFPLWDTKGEMVEVDIEIKEPILVKGFQEYFNTLWDRLLIVCKDRSEVIKRLSELAGKTTKDRADAG